MVEKLAKARADVNKAVPGDGGTALTIAAQEGHVGVVAALCRAGAHVDAAKSDSVTALMLACHAGHVGVVRQLLRRGADAAMASVDGHTALSLAITGRHKAVVRVLRAWAVGHRPTAAVRACRGQR